MPILSLFYGIIVRMYMEAGGRHNIPHIHAEYSGEKIVVSLDGEILEGTFPVKQLKLLQAWIIMRNDDLKANWELLSGGEAPFKIEPLK